ncbi:MAG: aspartate/glutamate racemase family protein [Acetobacterales bacterium]
MPRIIVVHNYLPSMPPMASAFAGLWPEAEVFHMLDEALLADVGADGTLTPNVCERVDAQLRHCVLSHADGVVYTGSTFGPAVDESRRDLGIPVLKPDEAMAEEAVAAGSRIGLMCVSDRSIPVITRNIEDAAVAAGKKVDVDGRWVPGAKVDLTAGRGDAHDEKVAAMAAEMTDCEVLLVGQISMARAAPHIAEVPGRRVLTTPDAAVRKLRRLLEA